MMLEGSVRSTKNIFYIPNFIQLQRRKFCAVLWLIAFVACVATAEPISAQTMSGSIVVALAAGTVAGNGTAGYGGDGGVGINAELNDPSGVGVDDAGNLYIADSGNSRIRRVDHATGLISTVAGNGTAGYGGDGGLGINAE